MSKTDQTTEIATKQDALRVTSRTITVGELEQALLELFPASDAESWDRTGLLVGDPRAVISGVAVALDATPRAVRAAQHIGANVLVTHHPAFLDPPCRIMPASSSTWGPAATVWEALDAGIALMNFHTTLDVSPAASSVLPGLLGLTFNSIVDRIPASELEKGYGQLCHVASDSPLTLSDLACRCAEVFGRPPRVWGRADKVLSTVVTCTGATGDLPEHCARIGADCLVCGEIRYHAALDIVQTGLAVIELGHDVSELPLTGVLAAAIETAGFDENRITILDQSDNWTVPNTMRRQ